MNTKQKLFTFTSIGAVFATAIAFVAITGARNLEQLRADSNKLSIVLSGENVASYDSEYGYFSLVGKTELSETPFSSEYNGTWCYSDGDVLVGDSTKDYIVSMTSSGSYDGSSAFSVNFLFKGPGVYSDGYVVYSKGGSDSSEHFTTSVRDEGLDLSATLQTDYGETTLVIKSITIEYTC